MNEERDEVQQLVARARGGELDAFEALYRSHQAGIYTFIRSQVGQPELAADLTQDTFVRAWQSLPRLRAVGAFRSWLHRIAANLVRDEVKSGRARLEMVASDLAADDGSLPEPAARSDEGPVATLIGRELKTELWSALAALSPEQRGAVIMHHLEGMSMQEIAEAMGVRPGTVMSRLARARETLRERLAPYVEGSDA
jgi:RNA polymerase sigma-70 factor (ECF subfamily)